jgi:hypothetical protein
MWGVIIEKLEELNSIRRRPTSARTPSDADDEPFDPTGFIDEDDEF